MTEILNENHITDCNFEEKDVGKNFKKTKTKLKWEFCTEGVNHTVELYDSKMSGKKKIIADGKLIMPAKVVRTLFSYSFQLDSVLISIVQNGNTYECRINNLPFNHLLSLQRNKLIFSKEGTSPILSTNMSSKVGDYSSQGHGQGHINFQLGGALRDTKESKKENLSLDKAFNFAIKERKGLHEDENENPNNPQNIASQISKESRFCTKNLEKFHDGTHSVPMNKNVNLIEFDNMVGEKPSEMDNAEKKKNFNFIINDNTDNKTKEEKTLIELPVDNNTDSKKITDLNDLFDTLNFKQPQVVTQVDMIKEVYNNAFEFEANANVSKLNPTPKINFFNLDQNKVLNNPDINATVQSPPSLQFEENKLTSRLTTDDNKFKAFSASSNSDKSAEVKQSGPQYPNFADMAKQFEDINRKEKTAQDDRALFSKKTCDFDFFD